MTETSAHALNPFMVTYISKLLISLQSVNKHCRHEQFVFLVDQFLKTFCTEIALPNEPKLGRRHLLKVPSSCLFVGYIFLTNCLILGYIYLTNYLFLGYIYLTNR